MDASEKTHLLSDPLVSIVIPMYNAQLYISDTVNSVKNQIYQNWECIIVDDHSEDESCLIVEEIRKSDNRIKLYIRPEGLPKGASACRNFGISCGQGVFFIFLDADDLLSECCLMQRVQAFQKYPYHDFLVFSMKRLTNQGAFTDEVINDDSGGWGKMDYLRKFFRYELPWAITCPIWKKDILEKLEGFDVALLRMQDPDLHTRALLMEESTFRRMNEYPADCYYRQGLPEKYLDPRFQKVVFFSLFQYFRKYYCLLKEVNEFDAFKKDFRIYLLKIGRWIYYWNFTKTEFNRYIILTSDDSILSFFEAQSIKMLLHLKTISFSLGLRILARLFFKIFLPRGK